MDETSSSEARNERDAQEPREHGEQNDGGHSGEGSASALAHLKHQVKNRHPAGEADDGPSGGSHGQASS